MLQLLMMMVQNEKNTTTSFTVFNDGEKGIILVISVDFFCSSFGLFAFGLHQNFFFMTPQQILQLI